MLAFPDTWHMTVTIVLLCLLAERFLLEYQERRQARWFFAYDHWLERQNLPGWMRQGFGGVISLLLPPLLIISILQLFLNDALFGLPVALFAGLVLLFSLGPVDLDDQIKRFTEAQLSGNAEQAGSIARDLLQDEPPSSEPTYSQALAGSVLEQANNRIFAVIFWFLILGPMGAALYRLASHLPRLQHASQELDFMLTSERLIAILNWLPARITAFVYAIAGSFEDALYGWRSYQERRHDEFKTSASGILICAGTGALRLSSLLEQEPSGAGATDAHYLAEAAMGLVWRSLMVWLVLLGVFSLAGWA